MNEIFEYFNTTNQTSPHYERHLNFAKPVQPVQCERINKLDLTERCQFTMHNPACVRSKFYIPYLQYFYCYLDDNLLSHYVGMVFYILICGFQFWIIVVTTTQFFVPGLTEVSRRLKMNEYLAGVTILALGNGAPDFFNCILTINSDSRHIYTDTMSVNLFLCVLTSSLVMWYAPFSSAPGFFLRDIGFVLLYVIYVDYSFKCNSGRIGIARAVSMACIYLAYMVVVLLDQYILSRKNKRLRTSMDPTILAALDEQKFPELSFESRWNINLLHRYDSANQYLFRQFFAVFDVLDRKLFKSKWTFLKLWALIKVVPLFCLRLFIPQINLKDSPYKWSKLLCTIQCMITPLMLLNMNFIPAYIYISGWPMPVILLMLCCSLPFAIWTFFNSRTDVVPLWYQFMIILNIIGNISILYVVSGELVALLETLGLILDLSNVFIGCTVYTWGSGLPDLIVNVGLARQGFPRMAMAACFAEPVFSTFVGIAMPVLYKACTSPKGVYSVDEGTVGETCSVFIIITLFTLVCYGLTTNFMLRRMGGLIGMSFYALFLLFATLSEFEVIHAFGTVHALDRGHFEDDFAGGSYKQ